MTLYPVKEAMQCESKIKIFSDIQRLSLYAIFSVIGSLQSTYFTKTKEKTKKMT